MSKVYSYLGLARRAGKIVSGEQAVIGGVKRGQVCLVLVAQDASSNTYRKFSALAKNHNVRCLLFGEKDLLGQALGQSPRSILGVVDRNFANVIQAQIKESVQEKN
ncbi:MAG TPA: ribosomal L7Ae/L30e/S12e/Gadd45 family protein [Limnochordia bacterium]|nr:ribosomal L7Ae/L30e/S12e/Gadd45 family protein [Limnochordia bacterium]